MNNYEADRAMNHKRIRMDGEGGPGVVQGNGLPLNYMDNGHQIPPYQPYASAYNAHYGPPDAFSAYGAPPPTSYAPQNLSYVPPAHQNYPPPPHHQPFPSQQPTLHTMTHNMGPAYDQGHHKVGAAWPPQASQVPQPTQQNQQSKPASAMMPTAPMKPPQPTVSEVKVPQNTYFAMQPAVPQVQPEVKMEPSEALRSKDNQDLGEEPPKIKIKTDLYKHDEGGNPEVESLTHLGTPTSIEQSVQPIQNTIESIAPAPSEEPKPIEVTDPVAAPTPQLLTQPTAIASTEIAVSSDITASIPPIDGASLIEGENSMSADGATRVSDSGNSSDSANKAGENFPGPKVTQSTPPKTSPSMPGLEPKKRGRPKGSTNKPKPSGIGSPTSGTVSVPAKILTPNTPGTALGAGIQAPTPARVGTPGFSSTPRTGVGRPRGSAVYQFAIRPFKKDFSGVQFKRRFSDDGLDSSHIPNEIYFGDVPVSTEVLFNYYDANLEKEKQATAAAAAARAAAARLHQAKLEMARKNSTNPNAVTTLLSSSSDSSSSDDSDSDSSDSNDDDNVPLKRRGPGRPKGSKNRAPGESRRTTVRPDGTPVRRGRPPVPPELRTPGITDMKKFLKAAGIKYDYTKLVDGCTKNKERVDRMRKLLEEAGLEGDPTIEKCKALKKTPASRSKTPKTPKAVKTEKETPDEDSTPRRVTRGQTSNKPRQKIVISSDEDEDSRTVLSRLKMMKPAKPVKREAE